MDTIEERIRKIEDREAIRELTGHYCHLVVERDAEALAALFTEDGEMVFEDSIQKGRDALRLGYRESLEEMRPKPCVHNHVIHLDGDRATGRTSVELRFVQRVRLSHQVLPQRVTKGVFRVVLAAVLDPGPPRLVVKPRVK